MNARDALLAALSEHQEIFHEQDDGLGWFDYDCAAKPDLRIPIRDYILESLDEDYRKWGQAS